MADVKHACNSEAVVLTVASYSSPMHNKFILLPYFTAHFKQNWDNKNMRDLLVNHIATKKLHNHTDCGNKVFNVRLK